MARQYTVVKADRAKRGSGAQRSLALTTPTPTGSEPAQDKRPGRTSPRAIWYRLYYPWVEFTVKTNDFDLIVQSLLAINCPVSLSEVQLYWPQREK